MILIWKSRHGALIAGLASAFGSHAFEWLASRFLSAFRIVDTVVAFSNAGQLAHHVTANRRSEADADCTEGMASIRSNKHPQFSRVGVPTTLSEFDD